MSSQCSSENTAYFTATEVAGSITACVWILALVFAVLERLRDKTRWIYTRLAIFTTLFIIVFATLHFMNTLPFKNDSCALGSLWDNDSIMACHYLLAFIAVASFMWPGFKMFWRVAMHSTDLDSCRRVLAAIICVVTLSTAAVSLVVIVSNWSDPTGVLASAWAQHTFSIAFCACVVVTYITAAYMHFQRFSDANERLRFVDHAGVASEADEHVVAKQEKEELMRPASGSMPTSSGYMNSAYVVAAVVANVIIISALLLVCVDWQLMYHNEWMPINDPLNFYATSQLAYHMMLFSVIVDWIMTLFLGKTFRRISEKSVQNVHQTSVKQSTAEEAKAGVSLSPLVLL